MCRFSWLELACLAPLLTSSGCGAGAASASLPADGGRPVDAYVVDAGCSPTGSVPDCPCAIATPGTAVKVGSLACASGVGPDAVACGQRSGKETPDDAGVAFATGAASVWVPFFTCPGRDTCSAVTTYDELTCTDESTGRITYYAILGAPCFHEQEGACSLDLGTVMECEGGTWTAFTACASHSCVQQGSHPVCSTP